MTREDIIRMARKSGAVFPADGSYHCFTTSEDLERFFHAAYEAGAAAERGEIAAMFDAYPRLVGDYRDGCLICGFNPKLVAEGVRARGEK